MSATLVWRIANGGHTRDSYKTSEWGRSNINPPRTQRIGRDQRNDVLASPIWVSVSSIDGATVFIYDRTLIATQHVDTSTIVSKLFPLFAFVFPFQNRHQQKFSIYGLIMRNCVSNWCIKFRNWRISCMGIMGFIASFSVCVWWLYYIFEVE